MQQMKKTAAFFDIDETVIKGSSSYYLARELYRRGFFGIRDIAFAAWHAFLYVLIGEDMDRIQRITARATSVMAGHSIAEVISIGNEMYDTMLGERVFAGTRRILQQHLEQGREVWLVSATPTQVVELIAHRMGATGGLGTDIVIENGVMQPRLAGLIMHGKTKAETACKLANQRGLELAESYAYSDSRNDLPLLHAVGHPVAINPDRRLRRYAKIHGWRIYDFRNRRSDSVQTAAKRSAQIAGALWFLCVGLHWCLRWLRGR